MPTGSECVYYIEKVEMHATLNIIDQNEIKTAQPATSDKVGPVSGNEFVNNSIGNSCTF